MWLRTVACSAALTLLALPALAEDPAAAPLEAADDPLSKVYAKPEPIDDFEMTMILADLDALKERLAAAEEQIGSLESEVGRLRQELQLVKQRGE